MRDSKIFLKTEVQGRSPEIRHIDQSIDKDYIISHFSHMRQDFAAYEKNACPWTGEFTVDVMKKLFSEV